MTDELHADELHANDNLSSQDLVLPFLIERTNIRGRFVRLENSINDILNQHDYPPAISHLLGEALLIVALIGNTVKLEGVVSMQLQAQRPISLLVVDYTSEGHLRGYVRIKTEDEAALQDMEYDFKELVGNGTLAITIDHTVWNQRYQGVVPLIKSSLAESVSDYFHQSEQLDTKIHLACSYKPHNGSGHWFASGLMLQRLPSEGGKERVKLVSDNEDDTLQQEHQLYVEPNDWEHTSVLFDTLTDEELLDPYISPENLVFRLFHEDGVRVFDTQPLIARCRCSRDKISTIIESMPFDQIEGLYVDGVVAINCEFCSKVELFTRDEIIEIKE